MGKAKIIQINKYYSPHIGGIERVVQQIAEGLAEETDMTVLVNAESRQRIEETINGVRLIRLPRHFRLGGMPISLSLVKEVRNLAKDKDVIHLHMPFPLGDLACLLSGYKGKIVLWWHSDVVRQKKLMILYKPIMLRMLKRADAIIVATKGHIEGSAYLKPFADKCRIIPFGVEKSVEEAADKYFEEKEDLQENVIADEQQPLRFLFVGRLSYYKGCDILLDAFAKVKGAELYLVGTGTLEEELKKKAEELKLKDKVFFVGKISEEELCRQYAECDVFVLPSVVRSEAFGLVQIEAMAFGKPVINTKLPSGVPYVSINKETGLTVEPSDAGELAEAMQWMVDNPKERLQMGERARERMKAEYRLEDMTARVLELYRELIMQESKEN